MTQRDVGTDDFSLVSRTQAVAEPNDFALLCCQGIWRSLWVDEGGGAEEGNVGSQLCQLAASGIVSVIRAQDWYSSLSDEAGGRDIAGEVREA